MKRVINIHAPLPPPPPAPAVAMLVPPTLVPLPAATNAFVARLLQHAERQKQAPIDGRRHSDADNDAGTYEPMTIEAWRADGLSARLQHMRDSMPLARADVALWFTANTAGTHTMIAFDAIPGISLGNSPLLAVIGISDTVERMMADDDAWTMLAGAVVRDLWLDSFTTYTPPLFVLLNSCMPGIRRPVPATINTVQLAMYYLAYIKLAADIGYRAPRAAGGDAAADAERTAPVRRALEGGQRLRAEKLQRFGENLLHLRLGQARRLHRAHTFVMLRILETELIGLVRLPGFAVALLTSAMMHTPVPELTDAEREWDKSGRHTVLALIPGVWKRTLETHKCLDAFREQHTHMGVEHAVTRAYMAFVRADRAKGDQAPAAVAAAMLAAEPADGDDDADDAAADETVTGAELSDVIGGIGGIECNIKGDARDEEDTDDAAHNEAELARVAQERREILARRDEAATRAGELRTAWLADAHSDAADAPDAAGCLERDIAHMLRAEKPPSDNELRQLKARLAQIGPASDRLRAGMLCVEALRLAKASGHQPGIQFEQRRVERGRQNMPRVAAK